MFLTVNEYAVDLNISPETLSLFRQLEVVKNFIAHSNSNASISLDSSANHGVPFIDILR